MITTIPNGKTDTSVQASNRGEFFQELPDWFRFATIEAIRQSRRQPRVHSLNTRRDLPTVLDRDFLETRQRVLDLAASLDRLDRAPTATESSPDRRLAQIRRALEALLEPGPDRAETVQMVFSLAYDADWISNLNPERRS